MSNLQIENVKLWARQSFKDFEPTTRGFCIPLITVIVNGPFMEVCDFELSGKSSEAQFLLPASKQELIKKLSHHCGSEKVNAQLRNHITYYPNT